MQLNISHKRKRIGSFVHMWMGSEAVIQNEESQKDERKLYINAHMWKSGKIQKTDDPIDKAEIETQNIWCRE